MKAENKDRWCGTHEQNSTLYKIWYVTCGNIKMNLRETGHEDIYGIKLAQSRVQWLLRISVIN
jgi:hypothetical protein